MRLSLSKKDWNQVSFEIKAHQKDYSHMEENGLSVFIYGYPFSAISRRWLSPQDVLRLYPIKGLEFIDDVEGVFTIVILDKTKKLCSVIVDRYGIYSLFYMKKKDSIILSDRLEEITAHAPSTTLNRQSIIEYLNFGHKLGNKTHIKDIYEFEGATVYQIDKQLKISQKAYWKFLGRPRGDNVSDEQLYDMFNDHIMTAMNLEEKVSLPLTGGVDTRTIFSACIPNKNRLHCYTHGVKNAFDATTARGICKHFRVPHSFYELEKDWVRDIPRELERNADIFNGLVPALSWLHINSSYEQEKDRGELLMLGVLGNQLWRAAFAPKIDDSMNIDDVSRAIVGKYTKVNASLTVYDDYNAEGVVGLLRDSVKDELTKDPNADNPVRLCELFAMRNYSYNWAGNSIKFMGKHFKIFGSLLHKEILQYIPLISFKEKRQGRLQKYIITKNSPYLGSLFLDNEETINNLSAVKRHIVLFLQDYRLGLNKISKKLLKRDIFKVPTAVYTDYPSWLRYHERFLLEILDYRHMLSRRLFNRSKLEGLIDSFLEGDNSLTKFMLHLVSLEMWLRRIGKEKAILA